MAISPITGAAALGLAALEGVSPKSTRADIQNTVEKLRKQRDEYKNEIDSISRDRKISELDKRIDNLEKRMAKMKEPDGKEECQTCKNRKYQDGSEDPGVSFKSPTKVDAGSAEAAVRSHEYEHVNRNQAKASREGQEVVYQSVRIKHGICPECGDDYVVGGVTTTVTKPKRDERFEVGMYDKSAEKGKFFDAIA